MAMEVEYLNTTAAHLVSNYSLSPEASSFETATFAWEELDSKNQRRNVYYTLHGVVGLLAMISNGFILYLYHKRAKVRKHVSFIMLNVFITCFIHGMIVGIMYPLQRIYRMSMSTELCVVTTMTMDFADRYTLHILPILAIERFSYVKYPYLRREKTRNYAIIATICLVVLTMLHTWLPLIPSLNVPTSTFVTSTNPDRKLELELFYRAYNCNYKINKKNIIEPYVTLVISALCVIIVFVVYIWMLCIAHNRLQQFPNMTHRRKYKMKRAVMAVMLVTFIFLLTLMPFAVVMPVRAICERDVTGRKNSWCNGLTIELRFIFSIIAHIGYIVAPLIFSVLSPHIRDALSQHGKWQICCRCREKGVCSGLSWLCLKLHVAKWTKNESGSEKNSGVDAGHRNEPPSQHESLTDREPGKPALVAYERYTNSNQCAELSTKTSIVTVSNIVTSTCLPSPQQSILSVAPDYY